MELERPKFGTVLADEIGFENIKKLSVTAISVVFESENAIYRFSFNRREDDSLFMYLEPLKGEIFNSEKTVKLMERLRNHYNAGAVHMTAKGHRDRELNFWAINNPNLGYDVTFILDEVQDEFMSRYPFVKVFIGVGEFEVYPFEI